MRYLLFAIGFAMCLISGVMIGSIAKDNRQKWLGITAVIVGEIGVAVMLANNQ